MLGDHQFDFRCLCVQVSVFQRDAQHSSNPLHDAPNEDKHAKQDVVAQTHRHIPMGEGKIEAFGMPGYHIPSGMRKARQREKYGTHP